MSFIDTEPRLLRPINYPAGAPGNGSIVLETAKGKVGVISVQMRTFMQPILENPFPALEAVVEAMRKETPIIFIDAHGETTSERIAIGRFMDGKVSAVVGTHTHVPTADETIRPGGTAYLSDVGMTGAYEGIIGFSKDRIIEKFLSQTPRSFETAKKDIRLSGVVVGVDEETGKATSIDRVQVRVD